ncbi:calmodulin-binding protein [Streptomyces cocklensis]|uniref:BP74 N-terminal domain-containing protein n=1 Tax=Actinacidiphila cocklensis TaxID=887465 RepID=A0A9W4E246_9ACTN|nr:calmodulin-binding protein [Actinacidiphila cocklensis]MDD1062587.1 calmodulin-binding protein [Actinacidiphila cocklensis]WSX72404.1 calmodulin-binding protein [Streptomyces sp. NBC_00899]WSX81525.1 calmodulin-binding protein [Streptomyces sp. NBC_00899]CAG6391850.1 conserved exported hypothetical protein [Actinacidiphila cocklensis]
MRRIATKICTIAATTLLALAAGQTGQAGAANAAYFNLQDTRGSNFTIEITRPEVIQEARDIIANENAERKTVIGRIIKTQASYNPQWDFHYNPDTVSFTDNPPEVCDGYNISYVEDHLDEAGGPFLPGLYWCPWNARLTAEIPAP